MDKSRKYKTTLEKEIIATNNCNDIDKIRKMKREAWPKRKIYKLRSKWDGIRKLTETRNRIISIAKEANAKRKN